MEFTTIEHNEVAGEDWRGAFRERVTDGIRELQQERAAQVKRRLYHGHKVYVVKNMTDAQIETVARLDAARDCERAINEQRQALARSKAHAGVSL